MDKDNQDQNTRLSNFYKGSMSGESWDDFLVRRMQEKREIFNKSFTSRKWGTYEIFVEEKEYLIKILTIFPRKNISMQRHTHRTEDWLVLEGKGIFVLDYKTFPTVPKNRIKVLPLSWHWVKNTSYDNPLCILETWFGDILEESDIEREAYDETTISE